MPGPLESICSEFRIEGRFQDALVFPKGHIHDSYAVTFNQENKTTRFLLQRINQHVFKKPLSIMENIDRITSHFRQNLDQAGTPDQSRKALTLVPTRQKQSWFVDENKEVYRMYEMIEDVNSFDLVESTKHAYQGARAFGDFFKQLTDLPGPRLHETIPYFHHTPKRVEALEEAIRKDPAGRVEKAGEEIQFALDRAALAWVLLSLHEEGRIPERVVHNDTKFNNVLLDKTSGEALCVVDLDTVMPGLMGYDFGDLVRTSTSPTEEDEPDVARVEMRLPFFEALVRGYLDTAGDVLTPDEIRTMAVSGRLLTYTIGIRFLTDHLMGDTYFKVHREGHNLDRARAQFALIKSMEEQEGEMEGIVSGY